MPTQSISPGPATLLTQGVAYALPSAISQLLAEVVVQGSTTVDGTFSNLTGSNVEPGVETEGGFIKCLTGNANVILKKHTISVGASEAEAPASPLLDGLVSYWKLSDLTDSHGTNTLTNNNGVTFVPGKLGNAGDFESSSSQYLSHADPSPLGDEDFTYALWFKRESTSAVVTLIGKFSGAIYSYHLIAFDFGLLRFSFNYDDPLVQLSIPNDMNWHFAVTYHDATANTLNLQFDNGTVASVATGGVFPNNIALPVRIGAQAQAGSEQYFDGLIDDVALWRRILTADERTQLYNSGNGLTYPFDPPAELNYQETIIADGAVAYWPLDDPSGTVALDKVGTRHGTISGGVTLNQAGIGSSKSMHFDGTGRIDASALPSLVSGVTYEFWIKLEAKSGFHRPLYRMSSVSAEVTSIYIFSPSNMPSFNIPGSGAINWTTAVPLGVWTHLVVTNDGAICKVFFNGTIDGTGSQVPSADPVPPPTTHIGADGPSGANGLIGSLQDYAVYTRALTPAEVLAHYNKRLA